MKPITQEEYKANLDEDLALLGNLRGLKIVGDRRINWSPFSRIKLAIDSNTNRSQITEFLESLPLDFEAVFWDPNFATDVPTEPGAYIFVRKLAKQYMYFGSRNQWHTAWTTIDQTELVEFIFRNRAFSRKQFEIFRKRKK